MECGEEFATFKVGDRVSAKILRVMEGKSFVAKVFRSGQNLDRTQQTQ